MATEINTTALKSQIKSDLNLNTMVRRDGANKVSVWLFPVDRKPENCNLIESWFNMMDIKRSSYNGISKPICVNGGEYNSLIFA